MNLNDSEPEAAFRAEVRRWLAESVPVALRDAQTFEDRLELDRLLAKGGYLGLTWPRAVGGQGRSLVEASILDEEATSVGIELAKSPSRIGQQMMAPAVLAHGSDLQRERFLPPVLNVEEIWCQGFSEPDAGSDLAAIRTRATVAEGGFKVNGTKIWTTQAQHADWCLLLARSDPTAPRHRNLAMLLVAMAHPGIGVTPIKQANGDSEFNEVHFDDVLVPESQVVGQPGDGWRVAMTTLSSERSYSLRSKYIVFSTQLRRIAESMRQYGSSHPLLPAWMVELGKLKSDVSGIRNLSYRLVSSFAAGEATTELGPTSHLWWSTTHQRLVEFGYLVATELGKDLDYWYEAWIAARAETIYGGTSQVQRNIISERILGMPR